MLNSQFLCAIDVAIGKITLLEKMNLK